MYLHVLCKCTCLLFFRLFQILATLVTTRCVIQRTMHNFQSQLFCPPPTTRQGTIASKNRQGTTRTSRSSGTQISTRGGPYRRRTKRRPRRYPALQKLHDPYLPVSLRPTISAQRHGHPHLHLLAVAAVHLLVVARAWPTDGETFRQLRYARRASFLRYKNPGYADETLWFPLCDKGPDSCDWYTYGSSQCIVHTKLSAGEDLPPGDERPAGARSFTGTTESGSTSSSSSDSDSETHQASSPAFPAFTAHTALLNSNCQMRSPHAGPFYYQLFHCPRNLPVSVFLLPKSGTTSGLNWLLQHEDVWPTLVLAAANMRRRPQDMMGWLSEEAAWWAADEESARAVANRVMHRWPARTEDQLHAAFRLFLPPAHLCPLCCAHGTGRLKVFVARNPFVRLVSFYKYRWLQGYDENEHHPRTQDGLTRKTDEAEDAPVRGPPLDETDESAGADGDVAGENNKTLGIFYKTQEFEAGRDRYYYSWRQFGKWVRKLLSFRNLQPFHKDAHTFQSREKAKQCVDSREPQASLSSSAAVPGSPEQATAERDANEDGRPVEPEQGAGEPKNETASAEGRNHYYHCVDFTFEFDASDIFHTRPLIDMLLDERFAEVFDARKELLSENHFILHLETLKHDLPRLYDRVCELYGRFCAEQEKGNSAASVTRLFVPDDNGEQMEVTSDYVGDYRADFTQQGGGAADPAVALPDRSEELASVRARQEDYLSSALNARKEFPKIYPTTNARPRGPNACDFDAKTLTFSPDCQTSWGQLWRQDPDLVGMVAENYALEFALFGYETTPESVLPIKGHVVDTELVQQILNRFPAK